MCWSVWATKAVVSLSGQWPCCSQEQCLIALLLSFGSHIFSSPSSTMFPKPWRVDIDAPFGPEHSTVPPHHFDELWVTMLMTATVEWGISTKLSISSAWTHKPPALEMSSDVFLHSSQTMAPFPILLLFLYSCLSTPAVDFAKWPFLVAAWYSNPMTIFILGSFVTFVKKQFFF